MDIPLNSILTDVLERHKGQVLTDDVAVNIGAQVLCRCYPGPLDISGIAVKEVGSYTLKCLHVNAAVPMVRELLAQHWEETESRRRESGMALNPDFARVRDLELQGRYLFIAAIHRDTAKMVGNFGLYISKSVHTQTLMATEDTLFVAKEHRRGRLGISIIRYAEDTLAQLGVQQLDVSVKLVNNVGQMIERMGYLPMGTTYTKFLEVHHVLP